MEYNFYCGGGVVIKWPLSTLMNASIVKLEQKVKFFSAGKEFLLLIWILINQKFIPVKTGKTCGTRSHIRVSISIATET
jgi:hypothetical protein